MASKQITSDYEAAKINFNLGLEKIKNESYEDAEHYISLAYKILPGRLSILTNYSLVLIKLNKFEKAFEILANGLSLFPDDINLYLNQAQLFESTKNWDKALVSINKVIDLNSGLAEVHNRKGVILREIGNYEDSIKSFSRAIDLDKFFFEAYSNLGNAFGELNKNEEAINNYNLSIKYNPSFTDAYYNLSLIYLKLYKFDAALETCKTIINIDSGHSDAFIILGNIYFKLMNYEQALIAYNRAIKINPNISECYNNRGNLYQELRQLDKALIDYDKAIKLNKDYAEAYLNRGTVFQELKNWEEALFNYEIAYKLNPDLNYLLGMLMHARMFVCKWKDFESNVDKLIKKIYANEKCSPALPLLSMFDKPLVIKKNTQNIIANEYPLKNELGSIPKAKGNNKIKIGYYSGDFGEHPVSYLTAELFELHDKNRFDLFAFYSGPSDKSDIHLRITKSFDRFINIAHLDDRDVARLSRTLEIDIAVDLMGMTQNSRVGIFSYRAAPIQISYIGYLGTMGAQYYDYLIADKTIIPDTSQQYYSEKIIYLPSYQVNDSKRQISDKVFTRVELNLPPFGFVYCCFNNIFKLVPAVFDVWMRILSCVPGSVLLMNADNKFAEDNLKKEAEKRNVCQSRLIFTPRINRSLYLARYRVADLFLDTWPYNAGTTASDALWAGLPVLTCAGQSFASRVAASLLTSIELPDLVTHNHEEYEIKAIELATCPEKLSDLRQRLAKNRLSTALFDTPKFTMSLEDAYLQIYKRYQSNLPLEHLDNFTF